MEYDPMSPIWLQVVNRIKGAIATGTIGPGEKMPGGRDLAVRFSINPNTAARVYQELERAGLCETRRGMGTYVTGDAERIARLRKQMAPEREKHDEEEGREEQGHHQPFFRHITALLFRSGNR